MSSSPALYEPFDDHIQRDPYPAYRALRDDHPVYWAPDSRTWVLSRYDDVETALIDPATFSSAHGIFPTPPGVEMSEVFLPMMIMMDPPRHKQMRSLVSKAFTPRRVAGMHESIQVLASNLFDQFDESGSCDFVADFAGPLPAIVIADLLGVPREDRHQFREWSSALVQSNPAAGGEGIALEAAASLYEYFAVFVAARRSNPQSDLITALVEAEVDGQRLSNDELLGFCFLLLVAGHETTSNLLGNAAVVLAQHADTRTRMAEHPATVGPAVEELLRFDSPVQGLARTLTRDCRLHDTTMKSGDSVLLLFGSANRDGRAFPEPDRFDIDRQPEHQVAFGRGAHFCLGAALARMEAGIAISTLLNRRPNWDVDLSNATRLQSGPIRGYASLPMAW